MPDAFVLEKIEFSSTFFFGNSFYSSLLSYICIIQIENISYIFIDTVSRINIRTRFVALCKRIRTVYCSLKTCK